MTATAIRVAIWGPTGTAGSAVVRACLADPRVASVLAITRRALPIGDARLSELRCDDFLDLAPSRESLRGVDAAFFCLGVSARQVPEESAYRRITKDYALAAANALREVSPGCVFHYVSGGGADPTGRSRMMWARVKGEAEVALLASGLSRVYIWRPSYLPPERGSGQRGALYVAARLLTPILRLIPGGITPTANLARAMLDVTFDPPQQVVFGARDINRMARR